MPATQKMPQCPVCSKQIDKLLGTPNATPQPGNLVVCGGCFSVLEFIDDVKLKACTEADLLALEIKHPGFKKSIENIIWHMKEFKNISIDTTCPGCKENLQGLADYSEQVQTMQPGNITLCVNCTAVLMLTEQRTFRIVTDDEIKEYEKKHPQLAFSIRMSQQIAVATKKTNADFRNYVQEQAKKN